MAERIQRGMGMVQRAKKAGRKFLAPVETKVGGLSMIFKVLPLYLSNREERSPKVAPGPFRTDPGIYDTPPASGLRITWFGHSSLLIEIDGVRVLVDPVWEERAAPVQWAGPKRFFAPTMALSDLPKLDAVLISHDHYDHLGEHTVRELAHLQPEARWVAPLAVGKVLAGFGVPAERVTELDWTDHTVIGGDLQVTAVPVRHFSGRSLSKRNETLWTAYALRGPQHNILYGADSGLWEGFGEIGATYGPFDLTMLEIGAYNELWKQIHMGPDGAAEAFQMLGGGMLMPIHWGLFDLALHAWRQPIARTHELAAQRGTILFSPAPGEASEPSMHESRLSLWWQT